jgi:uncharacterized protein (DUF885 family)
MLLVAVCGTVIARPVLLRGGIVASVSELSDQFVNGYSACDPTLAALMFGVGRSGSALTDYSPDGAAAVTDVLRQALLDVEAASVDGEAERLGAAWMKDWVGGRLGLFASGERERLVSPLVGPPALTRAVFDLMPQDGEQDWERIADRLEAVPSAMEGYAESLRVGLAQGLPSSTRLVASVAEQCRTWAGGGSGGWFAGFVGGYRDGVFADRLRRAGSEADRAYGRLASWLTTEYAPSATVVDGVGEERYRVWMAGNLGADDLDLDEAYEWGWEEWGRLENEKVRECDRIIPGSTFDEIQQLLNDDPAYSIDGVDAYRDWLQGVIDEAIVALDGSEFEIPEPLLRCDVAIPPEGSGAAPHYSGPAEDLSTPGRVWFPTMGATRFPRWGDVTTAYHEAVPGHHLQVGLTMTMPLTRLHRLGFNSAHGEGWALYAERLMDELGWFDTPDTRLGFLSAQAFRAARVVVDIGLHTGRRIPQGWQNAGEVWTYELAVEHMMRASGEARASIESEVLRYLSMPSQAITYKLGERAWLDARRDAIATAAGGFDRKTWHAKALSLGPMGLNRFAEELGGEAT